MARHRCLSDNFGCLNLRNFVVINLEALEMGIFAHKHVKEDEKA
jgi:hypothetical protein